MKCPNCGLYNPDSAQTCDCGYNFEKGVVIQENNFKQSYSKNATNVNKKPKYATTYIVAIMWIIAGIGGFFVYWQEDFLKNTQAGIFLLIFVNSISILAVIGSIGVLFRKKFGWWILTILNFAVIAGFILQMLRTQSLAMSFPQLIFVIMLILLLIDSPKKWG